MATKKEHVDVSGQNQESEKYTIFILEVTGVYTIQQYYAEFSCYLPPKLVVLTPPTQQKSIDRF